MGEGRYIPERNRRVFAAACQKATVRVKGDGVYPFGMLGRKPDANPTRSLRRPRVVSRRFQLRC